MDEDIEMRPRPSEHDIDSIFDRYSDGQDWIAVKQLEEILKKHGKDFSENKTSKLLRYIDNNKDGLITKEELENLYKANEGEVSNESGVQKKDISIFKQILKKAGNFILTSDKDRVELYERKYSCAIPPIFMILISVAEVAVYIYYRGTYGEWLSYPVEIIDSPLIFYPPRRNEVWRFLSYMFLHAGLEHIVFNVIFQLTLGVPLELVHGPVRVGVIYLAGVLGGSMASSVFEPSAPLIGASGGAFALLTAQIANVILNGDVMTKRGSFLRTIFVIFILCADFGFAIYRRLGNAEDKSARVSFAAHIAGSLAGVTIGLMVLSNFRKFPREKIIFWIAVGIYIAFMIFGIFWNAFWPHYPDK